MSKIKKQIKEIKTRDELIDDTKLVWKEFYNKILGEIRIGGYTGYLGRYATCAIETEETGHNADEHDRFSKITGALDSIGGGVRLLDKKLDYSDEYYGRTKDHYIDQVPDILLKNFTKLDVLMNQEEEYLSNRSFEIREQFKEVKELYNDTKKSMVNNISHISNGRNDETLRSLKSMVDNKRYH